MPQQLSDHPILAQNWQQQLAEAFSNINDLCAYLNLAPADLAVSEQAAQNFPLKVPLSFASCMQKGNPHDPLLLQVLPLFNETVTYPGFSNDPVGDLAAVTSNVIHKYQGRVLLINTGACAINCRYCFRRNFPYADLLLSKQRQNAALAYLKSDRSITEVILSGGDPLLLSDDRLSRLFAQLNEIPHLKRIRIHSRLPIVLPARISTEFINTLKQSHKQLIMVVHCNHANEINAHVIAACRQLKQQGITLFNQSVLLRNINDHAQILSDLSETLFAHGVIPYYLHLLDKAQGTAHFEVSEDKALRLIKQMQANLPGYLVPKLVREVAGANAKQSLDYS
ncbi:MAG: EF-P beta-lysylation protein EpmB [Methylococcales bacterium]